jgi:hypothetical protein
MEAESFSETPVIISKSSRRYITEDFHASLTPL